MAYVIEIYAGYKGRDGVIARMFAVDDAEAEKLMRDPLFRCFYRAKRPFHDRVVARAICERKGYELATPARVEAVKAVLADGPVPEAEVSARVRHNSELSFGHGNQIQRILRNHAQKVDGEWVAR